MTLKARGTGVVASEPKYSEDGAVGFQLDAWDSPFPFPSVWVWSKAPCIEPWRGSHVYVAGPLSPREGGVVLEAKILYVIH